MKKQKFSFADPDFSESNSDTQQYLPSSSLRQYNKQYSLIIVKVEQFFRECKTCIQKFVALNQFGVGLNLNHLMSVFSKMQRNVTCKQNGQLETSVKQKLKQQYQLSFHNVLGQMQKCIKDLLQYEASFKMQYFGQIQHRNTVIAPKSKQTKQINKSPIEITLDKSNNYSNKKSSIKFSSSYSSFRQPQQSYLDDSKIRQILTQKLNPHKIQPLSSLKAEDNYEENMESLDTKIDQMIQNMKNIKQKEESIIKIFNDNRFENTLEARKSKIDTSYRSNKHEILQKARMMIKEDYFDFPTAANSQYQYPQ